MTLRHRLECKIKTVKMVPMMEEPLREDHDVCLVSPPPDRPKVQKRFEMKDKLPWLKTDTPHKQMLVRL